MACTFNRIRWHTFSQYICMTSPRVSGPGSMSKDAFQCSNIYIHAPSSSTGIFVLFVDYEETSSEVQEQKNHSQLLFPGWY